MNYWGEWDFFLGFDQVSPPLPSTPLRPRPAPPHPAFCVPCPPAHTCARTSLNNDAAQSRAPLLLRVPVAVRVRMIRLWLRIICLSTLRMRRGVGRMIMRVCAVLRAAAPPGGRDGERGGFRPRVHRGAPPPSQSPISPSGRDSLQNRTALGLPAARVCRAARLRACSGHV